MPISDEDKQAVRARAKYISDKIDTLALACRRCNERRYNFVDGIDPETQEIVPIFNPRWQQWN